MNTLAELAMEDNPFLSLNLQLNQLLMLINNPMLFPHFSYAKEFKNLDKLAADDGSGEQCYCGRPMEKEKS